MVGSAVTVPVAEWIGRRLVSPGEPVDVGRSALTPGRRWRAAASSVAGQREAWQLSERPIVMRPRMSLAALLDRYSSEPLSLGATTGFTERLKASTLRRNDHFVTALDLHIAAIATG